MKRSIKELVGYTIQAIDGEKGKVNNFLFDDETWIVRYLEADLGGFFSEKRVVIPRNRLGEPSWEEKHFPIELTVKRIENSPGLDFDLPVSRAYEKELVEHYELVPYWPSNMAAYEGAASFFYPQQRMKTPKSTVDEENVETHLRSFREIRGYYIKAIDDRFGHIEDVIIDDELWQIMYVVIDTKNIVPWGKKVILPIELVDEINYQNQEARISLPKENIKDAPEYNPAMAVNAEFEKVLYDFYGRKVIH